VQVAIGRASDYFGPRGGAQSNLGDRVCPPALAGKTATVLGDPDQPHTYTYIPDIGEGLAVLGEHPDAPGEVWHLPNDPDTKTTRQLVDMVYQHAGRPRAKLRAMPPLLLRALGLVNPTVREPSGACCERRLVDVVGRADNPASDVGWLSLGGDELDRVANCDLPRLDDPAVESELAVEAAADVTEDVEVLCPRVGVDRRHDASSAKRVDADHDTSDAECVSRPVTLRELRHAADEEVRPQPSDVVAELADRTIGCDE